MSSDSIISIGWVRMWSADRPVYILLFFFFFFQRPSVDKRESMLCGAMSDKLFD